MKIVIIIIVVIVIIVFLVWLGLQIKPAAFPIYPQKEPTLKTIPLPGGLPAPVERFYRLVYGEQIPVIESAVITGHATMTPFAEITLPARFRFTHEAGKNYRHYIEATFYGIPVMKVNESYLDGHARMELPFGTDEGEKLNQAANLGLWSESIWLPAIFLTDERASWEPVDENTALLVVPFEDKKEKYVIRFDPKTGLIDWFESMRYRDSKSSSKILWLNHTVLWSDKDGKPFPTTGEVIWMDNGKPWATFTVDNIVYNVDVKEYVRSKGL